MSTTADANRRLHPPITGTVSPFDRPAVTNAPAPLPTSLGGAGGQVWSYTDYPPGKFKADADQIKAFIPEEPARAVELADGLLAAGAPRTDILLNRKAVALQRLGDLEGALEVLEQAKAHCAAEGLPTLQTDYNLACAHAKLATRLEGRDDYAAESLQAHHDDKVIELLRPLLWDFQFGAMAEIDKDFARYNIRASRPTGDTSGCCSETTPHISLA
jgi:hypothetical protein